MSSRSTIWRRRRRARDCLNEITPVNVSLKNLIENQSSHLFHQDTALSNPAQSHSREDDESLLDEQSTCFTTNFEDEIEFIGTDEEKYVFDDVQINSEASYENHGEDSEFFNL
ncbi:unnamed protein product [Rotaria sp. Silwood2]|nr:unnamed protein product [Rotaria sp. Silwood2]CAF3017598.1 unnamed protein product [Rotaria sp. Silwood2]CAF3359216.1 unnamed protein product [Rotaria sp. Silwood2]CAF4041429.1 unnamed protein product [Rotaria sp. Silwood2]CAF4224858.1 unnamed protein product [Rotaria sp. Silwood2]